MNGALAQVELRPVRVKLPSKWSRRHEIPSARALCLADGQEILRYTVKGLRSACRPGLLCSIWSKDNRLHLAGMLRTIVLHSKSYRDTDNHVDHQ